MLTTTREVVNYFWRRPERGYNIKFYSETQETNYGLKYKDQ